VAVRVSQTPPLEISLDPGVYDASDAEVGLVNDPSPKVVVHNAVGPIGPVIAPSRSALSPSQIAKSVPASAIGPSIILI